MRMPKPQPDVTTLLILAGGGDQHAQEELFRLVETELRRRAKALLRREQPDQLLQTTVLVDDAFVQLIGGKNVNWQNRSHFYALAAKVMRRILVDDARQRAASRRGGGDQPIPLDRIPQPVGCNAADPLTLLALDEALTKLAEHHPELVQVVELHHFAGWQLQQIADILGIPYRTVKHRWQRAKAYLHREMS
jgi:RNA polymerase sigma factor (TIGR02999 family)